MNTNTKDRLWKQGILHYASVHWKPGTLNRVEDHNLFVILKEGYVKNKTAPGDMHESAFSLDMADLDGVVQSSAGHDEELCERDSMGYLDPSFCSGYDGQFLIFTQRLNQRLRSAEYLSDDDLEKIMKIIQPDRAKPFRRRISQHLCDEDADGRIAIWPEVTEFLKLRNITVFNKCFYIPYLVSAFLSVSIGIYQFQKFFEGKENPSKVPNQVYYKPGANFCHVEHYYGVRAVGIEDREIRVLDIPSSQIVEPKDIWKFAMTPDRFKVKGITYKKKDLPKLIYPEELHKKLGL